MTTPGLRPLSRAVNGYSRPIAVRLLAPKLPDGRPRSFTLHSYETAVLGLRRSAIERHPSLRRRVVARARINRLHKPVRVCQQRLTRSRPGQVPTWLAPFRSPAHAARELTRHGVPAGHAFGKAALAGMGWCLHPGVLIAPHLANSSPIELVPEPPSTFRRTGSTPTQRRR